MRNKAVEASGDPRRWLRECGPTSTGTEFAVDEDSTSISYTYAVATGLGITGSKQDAKRNGFLAHSVLLLDAVSEHTVGLIAQQHWCRDRSNYGKKHKRKHRAYEDNESYKWEQASVQMAKRLSQIVNRP